MLYVIPEIVDHDIKVITRGNYKTNTGYAKGIIFHYTAGHWNRGAQSAINTLRYLAYHPNRLGCPVTDINGVIHKSKYQDWNDVAWHAGSGSIHGHRNGSTLLIGMEYCCAGLLSKYNGQHYPWWNFKNGEFIGGTPIPEDQIRIIEKQHHNQKPGVYHMLTREQEQNWWNFCLWQCDTNPEIDIDYIVSHGEYAPDRKWDIGGSFSMSMPEFREELRSKVS